MLSQTNIKSILSETALAQEELYRETFQQAQPFKHVLMENFLDDEFLKNILIEFPLPPGQGALKNEFGGASRKHAVHAITELGENFKKWDNLLQSDEFIHYLEKISGINDLIYDPEYHGAGTHNNLDGQGMLTHIDFNLHRTTGYHRRLNLIIYINEEWDPEWGGSLELHRDPWEPATDEVHIFPPLLNNAVLFETNEYSWHGFENIKLPEDKKNLSRKSLTVYYYSKTRPANEIAPKHGTIYVPRPIPESIQAGEVISEDDFSKLNGNLKSQRLYLKSLYKRESDLLTRIQGLNFRLNQYQEAFNLKSVGNALQKTTAKGLLPNGKVIEPIKVSYQSSSQISTITLHGYLPQFLSPTSFEVIINDHTFNFTQKKEGSFKLECDLNIGKNKEFFIQVNSEKYLSPNDVDGSPDKQKYGFIFLNFEFE